MSYDSTARALSLIQRIFITGGSATHSPAPPNAGSHDASYTGWVPLGLALLTGAALSRVPSRALSRTLLSAVLRSTLCLSTLCLGTLSRRCLTLRALSRITLSLGTTLTVLRMQRLQTRR